jgi:hypothetical protein
VFRERTGDLWRLSDEVKEDAVAITFNGYIKRNRQAALGRGCALEAAMRLPVLPIQLGDFLRHNELRTVCLTNALGHLWQATHLPYRFIAFPVKLREVLASEFNIVPHQRLHVPPGTVAPGWAAMRI